MHARRIVFAALLMYPLAAVRAAEAPSKPAKRYILVTG